MIALELRSVPEELAAGLAKLSGELNFALRAGGVPLRAERRAEPGFLLERWENGIVISYERPCDFYYAFSLALAYADQARLRIERGRFTEELGLMLDCSRNAVTSVASVKRLIRLLALMGFTYLELYTEDTFEVRNQPYFGYLRGRYTKDELKELDAYAKGFGIELVPCIQTLAHLNCIFKWDVYEEVHDVNDILLLREEKTYALLEDMFATVADAFTSRRINIGMDEAHMVGLGKFLDRNGVQDRYTILLEHLGRVLELCRKYGFRPHMWSDMFFRLALKDPWNYYVKGKTFPKEAADLVPADVELIYWDYYHDDYEMYEEMIREHRQLTDKVMFAGGAWKWSGFAPHNALSNPRTELAMEACRKGGVRDVLATAWGDNGGECPVFSVLPSLMRYGELAYGGCEDAERQARMQALTGYTYDEFLRLDRINVLNGKPGTVNNPSKYLLYNDPMLPILDRHVLASFPGYFAEYRADYASLAARDSRFAYLFRTLEKLSNVLEQKCDLGVRIKAAYDAKDRARLQELATQGIPQVLERLEEFWDAFRAQWDTDNKPFGFEVQDIRIGGLEKRLRHAALRIKSYLDGSLDSLPELEQERLPATKNYDGSEENINLNYNAWIANATNSVL